MGAAIVALWPGVDDSLYPDRDLLWRGLLNDRSRRARADYRPAVYPQSHLQLLLHLLPVQIKEQPPRRPRCLAGLRDIIMDPNPAELSERSRARLGYLSQHSLSPLGVLRHDFAADGDVFESVDWMWRIDL